MPPRGPLVIPVEKKGRFSECYALRFLCFDPCTRMTYLSDKGTKVRFWKHRLKLYAVVPKLFEVKDSNGAATSSCRAVAIDFRDENFDANDLLTFVLHGVSYHRLDPDNASDRRLMEVLPSLLQVSFEDSGTMTSSGGNATVVSGDSGAARYHDGEQIGRPSEQQSLSLLDDGFFFGRDRTSWLLRCPYYGLWEELMMAMRDALIADGLRVPIHGNFPSYCDPRNGLQLVSFPLWLQRPFHMLSDAIVYTCMHARMVGCSPQGAIGVCMRHCYVCITDQDVLMLSETGFVARWMPLSHVERLDYSLTGGGQAVALKRGHGKQQPQNHQDQQPFISFVCRGGVADVLLLPCDPFTRSTASASMAAMMPHMNITAEIRRMITVLEKLTAAAVTTTATATTNKVTRKACAPAGALDADADIELGEEDYSTCNPDLAVSAEEETVTAHGPSFTAAAVSPETITLEQYCDGFATARGRAYNWQPLPGTQQGTPSVMQAATLAARLRVPQPKRQAVTLRPEFQMFYFPDRDPAAQDAQDHNDAPQRGQASGNASDGGSGRVDDLYEQRVPTKRASKLLNALAPDRRSLLS